jgi:molecular chaperone GrpE
MESYMKHHEKKPEEPATTQPEQQVETPTPEVMPSLEELLKQAELKAQEHHDAWLRAKAEGENIRRRAQEDISKAQKFAV